MTKMATAFIKSKLLCIIGPTATGKTDAALFLAHRLNGELIACDSRQVYKGLDLGTGKEASTEFVIQKGSGWWIVDGIKIWGYDTADFDKQYSLAEYTRDAKKAIDGILKQNKLPIIAGGTGLYLNALLNGVQTSVVGPNLELRRKLEGKSLSEVQQQLKKLAPEEFKQLNNSEKNNQRRLIRKIEIIEEGRGEITSLKGEAGISSERDVLKIGLTAPREILNDRIEKRVLKRIRQGMIEETKKLYQTGLSYERMRQLGLEYGVMADFLEGQIKTEDEFVKILQQRIKQYAKRQLTWFKKDKDIVWIDITDKNFIKKVEKTVLNWYNSGAS